MENQMTVDEQLDRMNEAEFKAFLEACTPKTKRTLEQAAMFSQLDRPGKVPEEQIPPLTTTKHSSSLQSLSQSHSRKNSQVHTSKPGTSSGITSSTTTVVGGSGGYQSNNNTHHHTYHLNSNYNSNNNHNLLRNTNCASTSTSSTSSSGDHHHFDPSSYTNSQNKQQTVNCAPKVSQNNCHHLSSYYSSTSSSRSQTEEDTTTTSANSNSSSPNSTSYSTAFTTTAQAPNSRQYRYHLQPLPNPNPTTTSSNVNDNFNLKRPTPKPLVQNHVEASVESLPSPYFFNCRTAPEPEIDSCLSQKYQEQYTAEETVTALSPTQQSQSEFYLYDQPNKTGNFQLRSEYPSVHSLTSSVADFGTYKQTKISPRSSRSGTPVHGETASASLNFTRRAGTHGGARNKKPKETILSPTERNCIADRYENLEDLVSYITGEPEKNTQTLKKPKKKPKRKETLSKSHSLDENTLGSDVNPSMETRSVSSTLLENKEEKQNTRIRTEGLDLSPPSTSKLEQIRSHASTEFITVTNRKKSKNSKSGEIPKGKDQNQKEDSPKSESSPPKPDSVPKDEPTFKQESVLKKEGKDSTGRKDSKEPSPKQEPPSYPKTDNMAAVAKAEPLSNPSSHTEINPKKDVNRRYDTPLRKNPEVVHRKYPDSYRRQDGFRRADSGPVRRQEQVKRKESAPKDSDFPQLQESIQQKRQLYSRNNSEPTKPSPAPLVVQEAPPPKPVVPKQSPPDPESAPFKSEEAVKFCGVNFENKSDILAKPTDVEFGFGVSDFFTQFASGAPELPQDATNNKLVSGPVSVKPLKIQTQDKEKEIEQPLNTSEIQNMSIAQSTTSPQPKQQNSTLIIDKESLLGRHPQSVLSPPMHYMPVSVPLPLPMAGTGYPLSTANFFQPIQQPGYGGAVGVMQYFPANMNMTHIPQTSAPIMTAIPTQGSGNMQPQFVNPISLTPQQQQQIIQQQLLHHQQQQAYNPAQQSLIQYPLLLKPSPTQQQYGGNQQNVTQFTPPPPPLSTTVPLGQQSSSYSHIQGAGNYNNYSRNNNMIRSNQPQLGNYGIPPQSHQQYGPSQPYSTTQNSSSQHYNNQGPQGGQHYSYGRGNSRNSNQNSNISHTYGPPQPSPQYSQGSGHSPAQPHHTQPNHGHRSLSSHVQPLPPGTYAEVTVLAPQPLVIDGYMVVNPGVNPMANYYNPPPENEVDVKYARAGEEFMNDYVEKINERISKGATVHRL